MKVKSPEKGMIVESLQGRDKGCLYAVSEVLAGGKVAVVDGKKRTLASPKIKNIKHLRLTPQNIAESGITAPWDKAFDNRVAHLLKTRKKDSAQNEKSEE